MAVFAYTSKLSGRTYYLHRTLGGRNKAVLWYFSLSPTDGVEGLPVGFYILEACGGYPMLKKQKLNK